MDVNHLSRTVLNYVLGERNIYYLYIQQVVERSSKTHFHQTSKLKLKLHPEFNLLIFIKLQNLNSNFTQNLICWTLSSENKISSHITSEP